MATQAEYQVVAAALLAYAKANIPPVYSWVLTEHPDVVAQHAADDAKRATDDLDAYRARMAAVSADVAKGLD